MKKNVFGMLISTGLCVAASAQVVDPSVPQGTPRNTPVAPVKVYEPAVDLVTGQLGQNYGGTDNLPQSVSFRCSTGGSTFSDFCGAVLDYDGADWIMVKVQQQLGTGKFGHIGFYHGTTTGWAGMTGGTAFFAVPAGSEFTSATITVTHDGAGNVTLDISDVVGGPAQSYTRGGWTPRSGTVSGIQCWNGIYSVDNFSEGFTTGCVCDNFNRNDGGAGADWIIQGSATMSISGHAAKAANQNACLYVGSCGDTIDEVEGDVALNTTSLDYIALVAEGAEGTNLFVKLQGQTGTGLFSNVGFYRDNNSAGWPGITGGATFFSLPAGDEFKTAHAKLTCDGDGDVRLLLTNIDGDAKRVREYTRGNWIPTAGNRLGYGAFAGNATIDNLQTAGLNVDNFNRPNGPLGGNWNTTAGTASVSGNRATGTNSLSFFVGAYTAGGCYADCDGNGTLDFFDFLCFQNAFQAGCP